MFTSKEAKQEHENNVQRDVENLKLLSKKQIKTVENLQELLKELQKDENLKEEYGVTNIDELLAELVNEEFVNKLKAKKFKGNESFFDKIVSYIVKLLGLNVSAYDIVYESLETLVENSSVDALSGSMQRVGKSASSNSATELSQLKKRLNELNKEINQIKTKYQAQRDALNPKPTQQTSEVEKKGTINVYWGGKNSSKPKNHPERILSNLAERKFTWKGREYGSVEHAYQSNKSGTFDQATYGKYERIGGYGSKIRGKGTVAEMKAADSLGLMKQLVVESFKQNPNSEAAKVLMKYENFTHNTNQLIDQAFLEGLKLAQKTLSKPTQQVTNKKQSELDDAVNSFIFENKNEAVEDDPLKGMPFDTESDEMIDLGDIPRDSNPVVEKFKKDIKVIAAYFRAKGEKTSITLEDVFNMMVVNEENPGELLNMFTFASLQQAYEEIHTKAKSKSPAFRQGEIKMLENRLKKIFNKGVQNPKQEHVNLKAQTYSHVPLGTQTAKKETTSEFKARQIRENTLGLEEQPQMVGEQKSGMIPRLGFLGLAFKRFLEKGVVITRTTDYFNLQLPDIDGRWDRVDPRPLLHPDTPNSFEVGVEIASEDSWDRIPVATEVKDEAGNPEYISFKNWVKEKESKDPNFRNTQEFFDKVPIYATMDGKKVSFIHDQDWFNGYSVSAPFENEGDSYIHPRDAMNNVSWAYHINQAKKRNGELRAKILQGKNPLRKLKVNKLQDKNVLNFIPTEESDLIPLIQANPQADLHVTTQNGRENFINNHPKLKTGEWELTNKKDSTFEGVTGHTFALFRVGSRINDKGVKVKTYQAVKLHRQFAHNPNTDSEIESVLRAFGMHTALNKKARNKISKEFKYSTESARKQNNTLGRKYNKTLSTNDGFINYFSMFFKITPKGVKKVDTELKRKKINDEYEALIKKGLNSEEAQLQAVSKVDAEYKNNRGTNYLPVAMILEEAMSITNSIKRKEFLNEHLAQTTRAVDLQQNTKVAHISDTGVQDTGQTYKDYLMTTFQTSLKAFDMSTGNEASVYSPVIQTIIEIEDGSESTVNEEVTPTETEKVKPEVKPEKKTEEQHLAELQENFSSQSTAPQGDVFTDYISGITYVANEEGQYIEVKDKAPKTEELQKEEKEERTEVLEIEQFVEDFLKTDIDSYLEEDEMITIGELEDTFQGTIAEVPYAKARSFISLIQNTLTRKSDFRDKLSNRSIKIIRAVAKRRVQLHSAPIIKKIEANLEALQQLENPTKRNLATIKALQQNLAYFKASVDSFEEFFKVALEKSVSETDIDTSDYDSSSETEEIEKNYSKESVEETVKSRATGKLKTLLSGIPQYNSKGEISYGYGGVPNYLSLDDAYNLVLKALSIGVDPKADFDYLITKLEATDNPSLNEIIKRLKNSDGQLKNQFVVNTTMHSLTSRFLMFDVDYNGKTSLKVYDTNSSTTKRAVVDIWKDNVLTTKLYDELGNFNSVHAQSLLKRFADFPMDFDEVGQGQLRKFLEDLGIEMHDKAWESILNVGVTSGTKSYNLRQMFDSTKKGEKDLSLFTKINEFLKKGIKNPEDYSSIGTNIFDDISGLSSGLAQLEAEYNPELISTVFRDSGKTISTLVPPKFITDEVSKILESANGDNKYIDEITQFPYSGNSLILQALVENPEFRDYYGVNHMSLTALKDRNKRTTGEKKYNELDASETLMTALGFFQDRKTSTFSKKKEIDGIKVRMGQMMNQTMSDKSTALSSGTVIYDILSDLEEHFSMDTKSGLVTGLSDKLLSVMFDRIVSNQVLKILDMHQRTTGSTIKSYDKASTLFIDIPGLNSLQIDGVNLVEYLYNVAKDNPLGGIDENAVLEKIEEPVKALLSKIVDNEVENKIEIMQKFGVKEKGNSMIDDKYIQEHLKKPNASNPEVMKIALYDFVFNDMIFKSEMNKLFISDLALYHKHKFPEGKNIYQLSTKEYVAMSKETGVNIGKRLALLIAPGRKIASSTQKYEQIFLEDPVDISENMSYLIKLFHPDKEEKLQSLLRTYIEEPSKENYNAFEKIAPEIAGYLQLESADAQEYTTVGEHLNVMYLSGKLSEDEYNNLKTAYETGGFNSLTKEEKKIVLQPVKPVYTGIHNDVEQGVRRVVYIKSSSIPLLPELTKGTELDNLRVQMEKLEEKGNFVRASYQTANKIGASVNTVDIRDPESLALINLENSGVTMTLDRSNFKIQQDVPHKSSKAKQDKVSMGTQIFKLLLGDGVLDVEGDVFPYKGKMISAEELKKNFNESFSIIYDNSYNSLLEELGFLDGQGGDNPAFNDRIFKRNLSDLLKKEAETRGYDLKSVAGLKLNKQGEFEIPLWLSSDSNRFESLLNSIITNRIMQFKLPGNGFVAASENGTKFKKEFNDLSDSDKNDIIYLDGWNGVELKGTTDDNGEMKSAQIMIESKFKDSEGNLIDLFEQYNKVTKEGRYIFRDEQGILRLKEGAIDSELFNMFSFRTPTSGHVSSSSIEIVGILPSTAGDQMVVPKNFTKQKGLDFDVDKETAYMLNHYLDTDENIQAINDAYREALQDLKYEDYSIDPYIENFIFDQTNLSHTISERDVRFTGYNIPKRKRPLIYKLARIIAFEKDTTEDRKEKIEKLHKGLGELFGEDYIQDSQIIKDELIAQINLDPKQYDKVLKQLIEDFSARKAPIDEFIKNTQKKRFSKKVAKKIETKIAENDFIRTHLAVAKSPSTEIQKKFNKILSMSYAGSQAAKIEELNNEGNEAKLLAKIAAKHKVKTGKSMSDEAQIAALEEQESLFTLLSHDYQKDKMDLGAVGKGAIGVYSVAITFASQLQQAYGRAGMYIGEFTIGNYTSTFLGAVNTIKTERDIEELIVDDYVSIYVGDGNTINPKKRVVHYSTADMLAEKQNTSTDNEKEQILGRVGVDEISITADAHGSLRGFGKDENGNSIMYQLLSQPIVKEFNKRLKESRGLLGDSIKEKDLINEILKENGFDLVFVNIEGTDIGPAFFKRGDKKYLNPLPLGSSELTGNSMVDGIASGNTTQEIQGEALKTYFELLREGRGYIGKISSLNSNELGKSAVGVRVKRNKLVRALSDERMIPLFGEEVEYGTPGAFSFLKEIAGIVIPVGVMPTTPQGKIAIGGILAYEKLFSGLFPFSNEAVASQLDYVLSIMNVPEEYRSDEKYEEIFREMKKYIFSRVENNIISRNPNQVRRELMVDTPENTSLSTYIKTVLKGKNKKYAKGVSALLDNALVGKKLKYIVGKNEEEVFRIVYENANSENIDERELYEALPALVINDLPLPPKDELPYSTKELAEDLIRYAFLEGGIQEANQFMKFIPVELLSYFGRDNKSVSDAFQELDKKKIDATFFNELLKRFPKQYFQNNPASAQKIPTNKIVSNDGRILVARFKIGEKMPRFYQVKDTKRNIQLFELINGGPNYKRVPTMSTKRISQYNPNGEVLDVRADTEENYTNSLDLIPESLKNLYESIEQGVSVKEVLESIMPFLIDEDVDKANFVEQLIKYVQDGKVVFTESVGFMSTSAAGDVKINPLVFLKKAAINPSYVLDTLLHETIHTTTTRKIREYFDVVNREYILKPEIKNVPSFVTDMIVLHNESKKAVESYILDNYDVSTEDVQAVKNMLGNRSVNVTTELKNLFPDKNQEELYKVVGLLYSVINPAEMMSTLMNDKTYFDILKNTKYKNTTDTLLDRIKEFFIEAVQNLFPDIKEGTLAKAVINNMFETMSEQYTALDKLDSQDEMIDIKKEESKEEDSGMNTGIIFKRKEFEYKIEGFKDFVDNQSDEMIDVDNLPKSIANGFSTKLKEKIFKVGKIPFEKIELKDIDLYVKKKSDTEFSLAVDNKGKGIFGKVSAVLDFQRRDLESSAIYNPNPNGFILWDKFLSSDVASAPKSKVIVDNRFFIAIGALKALQENGINSIEFPENFLKDFKREYGQLLVTENSSIGFSDTIDSRLKTVKINIKDLINILNIKSNKKIYSENKDEPVIVSSTLFTAMPDISEKEIRSIYDNYVSLMGIAREGKEIPYKSFKILLNTYQVIKDGDTYIFGQYNTENAVFLSRVNSSPNSKTLLSETLPKLVKQGIDVISLVPKDVATKYKRSGYSISKEGYVYNFKGEDMTKYLTTTNPNKIKAIFNKDISEITGKEIEKYNKNQTLAYTPVEIQGSLVEKAGKDLNKILETYLSQFGIVVKDIESIKKNLGIDEVGFADILSKIAYIKDKKDLPPIAGEFIAYMMQYNPLVSDIIKELSQTNNYKKLDKAEYFKIIGGLISEDLQNKLNENYSASLLQKLKQLIKDFFSLLNNTPLDLINKNVGIISNNILQQNKKLIAASLYKPGAFGKKTKQVSLEEALESDKFGKSIIYKLAIRGFILTGSTSLGEQGTIQRPDENLLHDIDWVSPFSREETERIFKEVYPESYKIRDIYGNDYVTDTWLIVPEGYKLKNITSESSYNIITSYDIIDNNGKTVGTYRLKKQENNNQTEEVVTGIEGKVIDFFTYEKFNQNPPLVKDGIKLANWKDIFKAKLEYARYKDIWDYNRFIPNENVDIGSENSYIFEETNSGQSVEDLIEYEDWADMTTAERNKFKECN